MQALSEIDALARDGELRKCRKVLEAEFCNQQANHCCEVLLRFR